jgi:hypothetical protein
LSTFQGAPLSRTEVICASHFGRARAHGAVRANAARAIDISRIAKGGSLEIAADRTAIERGAGNRGLANIHHRQIVPVAVESLD